MPSILRGNLDTAAWILIGLLIQPCAAAVRSRDQFKSFFPTFQTWFSSQYDAACADEQRNYFDPNLDDPPGYGHMYAWGLADCILRNMAEIGKAEMALSSLLLALLPTVLAQVGPSQTETALLSVRRPLLAFLLEFGTPAPNASRGNVYKTPDVALRTSPSTGLMRALEWWPKLTLSLITIAEYAVAAAAVFNCVYQMYRLTYQAVALAPIVVLLEGVPETALLFFWVLLLVPIHCLNLVAFRLGYRVKSPRTSLAQRIGDEFIPCFYGVALQVEQRQASFWQWLLNLLTKLLSFVHIIMGTVLLGGIMFVTVADMLPVVEGFVGSALASRLVLLFELQGLRIASTLN